MQVHTSVYEVSKASIPLYPIRKVQLLPETNKKKSTCVKSIKNKTDTKQCFSLSKASLNFVLAIQRLQLPLQVAREITKRKKERTQTHPHHQSRTQTGSNTSAAGDDAPAPRRC